MKALEECQNIKGRAVSAYQNRILLLTDQRNSHRVKWSTH